MGSSGVGIGAPDPAATRRRILAAAEELYLDQGLAATTLSAVAQRAGVSRPTVYKHFGNARSLATTLIADELAVFFDRLTVLVAEHETIHDKAVEGLAFAVEYARDHRLLQRLLQLESEAALTALTTGAAPVLERAIAIFEPELTAAAARGELSGIEPDAAAEWLARLGLSLVLTPSVTRDLDDPGRLRRHVTAMVVGGIVDPGPSPRVGTTGGG